MFTNTLIVDKKSTHTCNSGTCYTISGMSVFLKNTSFHGILLDSLFDEDNSEWEDVRDLVSQGIRSGVVRPLSYSLFEKYKIEEAFRFMASGKHIGKVLVEVSFVLIFDFFCTSNSFCAIFCRCIFVLYSGFLLPYNT